MKKIIYLILLFSFISNLTFGQSISKYFKAIEKGESTSINKEWFTDKKQKSTYKKLKKYLDSENRELRYNAYFLSGELGLSTTKSSLKSNIVLRLINGLNDEDDGVRKIIYTNLKKFNKENYNYHSQEKIEILLQSGRKLDKDLILISGWIANDKIASILKENIKSGEIGNKDKLYYNLALARLGNKNSIEYVVRVFSGKTLNDRLLYAIGKDLLYTKQLDIYNLFITAIFSDDENCSSGNPNLSDKISCAYQIMTFIAPYIVNYPIKVDNWGDATIEDNAYEKTLIDVRSWLTKNNENIEFVKGY